MKKLTFLLTMLMLAFFTQAQTYKDIGNKVLLRQYKDAKADIDKRITNEKFASKPDAFILKATIYAALAAEAQGDEAAQLLAEAETAFNKYKEMDPSLDMIKDPVYQSGPVNIYSSLYNAGFKDYQAKNWEKSFEAFKKVVGYSDILISKEVLTTKVDTNALILAGYTAENSNHKEDAAKYYTRLADNKIAGEGNEFPYRFLVMYYFGKNDIPSFEKYRTLGKELYPNSEFFQYDQTDFAAGLNEDFNQKIKSLEDVLAKDPNNYKAHVTIAQLIYDTLTTAADVPKPANADELETKMIQALTKAAELKPDDGNVLMVLGDYYIGKAEKVNDERSAHVKAMQSRTKPGTKPSKEDIAKRDALDKKYGEVFDAARAPYEKAAALFAKKSSLTAREKQQYRNIAGYLGDIYNYKRTQAKASPAEAAKFEAESKKWNDLYDSLR